MCEKESVCERERRGRQVKMTVAWKVGFLHGLSQEDSRGSKTKKGNFHRRRRKHNAREREGEGKEIKRERERERKAKEKVVWWWLLWVESEDGCVMHKGIGGEIGPNSSQA